MQTRRLYFLFSLLVLPGSALAQPQENAAPMAAGTRPAANPAPAPGPAFQPRPVAPPRRGTPKELLEQDIQSFFKELNNLPETTYGSSNIDGRLGYYGAQEWITQMRPLTKQFQLILDQTEVVKLENNLAEVRLTTRIAPKNAGGDMPQPMVSTETTIWRFGQRSRKPLFGDTQNRWRIVPPEKVPENPQEHPIVYAAYSLGQPPGPSSAAILLQQRAMSNVKQILLGTIMFSQDYDEFLAFDAAHAKSSLLPYIKSSAVFEVPSSKDEFVFNDELAGVEHWKIDQPHALVCFYDGVGRTLNYRFDGKAVVGFADGHVEMVDPERAKTLAWEPKMLDIPMVQPPAPPAP